MNYINNQLEELTNKARFYKQFNVTSRKVSWGLLSEFLYSLYNLFEFIKNPRVIDGHLNDRVDFMLYFRSLPVVVAKIIDMDTDVDRCVKDYKSIFSLNKTVKYIIFSDGIRYQIYQKKGEDIILYAKMDLSKMTELDENKYFSMGSMNIISEIDEVLCKTHKITY